MSRIGNHPIPGAGQVEDAAPGAITVKASARDAVASVRGDLSIEKGATRLSKAANEAAADARHAARARREHGEGRD
jgi:hypothetical protein